MTTAAFSTGGAAAGPAASESNALAEFNKRFRAAGEAKDAAERDAKAARKAAGKAGLKKLLAERKSVVDARKGKNREDEKASEQSVLDGLQGESWARVVSLVDVHGGAAAAAAPAEKKGKHAAAAAAAGDTTRMKDVLIGLKAKPLAGPSA